MSWATFRLPLNAGVPVFRQSDCPMSLLTISLGSARLAALLKEK